MAIKTLQNNKSGNTKDMEKNLLLVKKICTFAKILLC